MTRFDDFKDGDNIEFELIEFAQEDGSFTSYARPYSIEYNKIKDRQTNRKELTDYLQKAQASCG